MKDDSIVIEAPRVGIAQSPHVGNADVRNLDIFSIPGVARLNTIASKKSSTTVTAFITWAVRHPIDPTQIYAIDNAGTVYKSSDTGVTWAVLTGTSSTNAHGNGLAIWKNYLFVARDTNLDVCGDGTSSGITSSNWTLGWKTIDSDVLWHPMITSKLDTKLYGGAGKYIFTLEEVSGSTFAPGNSATFNWSYRALGTIPTGYRVKCLEELGNNLLIGTWQGTNIYDIRDATIFTWDGGASTYGQPIIIDDYGVHAMKNIGNSVIVLAGINGTIRKTDGVNAYIIGQIPTDLSGGKYLEFYPSSICSYKNKVFFGTGNGGSTAIGGQGVYSLEQTGKGNILNLEHLNSSLTDGSAASVKISALIPITRDTLLFASQYDGSTYGIDLTSATSYAYSTNYSGYFDTPLFKVGTPLNKRTFAQIEFQFAKPLATGEGIQLSYRNNLNDSFTTIGSYTYSTIGAKLSYTTRANIPECEFVQVRVGILGTSTTTPQFKSVTLR